MFYRQTQWLQNIEIVNGCSDFRYITLNLKLRFQTRSNNLFYRHISVVLCVNRVAFLQIPQGHFILEAVNKKTIVQIVANLLLQKKLS